MAKNTTPAARIATIEAEIADIQSVWADSDEQERACFAADIADFRAELDAIRSDVESAKAERSWARSAARIAAEIQAFSVSSSHGSSAREVEASRIRRGIERAERSAFERGVDKREAGDAFRAAVIAARAAAARWNSRRAEQNAGAVVQREPSPAERQFNDDVRVAFRF